MHDLTLALVYGAFAGLMIPAGATLARVERIRPHWLETEFRHSVMSFGGGVLVAAVALVLVPEGIAHLPPLAALAAFGAGGALFALLEWRQRGVGERAQLLAMLTDFVPEALALGALIATGAPSAGLLALLIGLQNLPEGFNAYRELAASGAAPRRVLALFLALALLGPAAALAGFLILEAWPAVTAMLMLAAAGGILYLTFQDIAPEAHLTNRQVPSLAAVAGFGLGLLGHMLLG